MTTASPESALRFRAAVPADARAVVALVESAYRGEASRAGWTTEADLLDGQRTDFDAVLALIGAADGRIVVAECAGAVLGCAHLQRAGAHAWFGMYAVWPRRQGQGIGSALLAECERIAREEWACTRLCMSVIWTRAELIAYYQRRGYRATGERKPFPYGDHRFGLPRRPDLYFDVYAKDL